MTASDWPSRIRAIRKARGLTQAALAERIGMRRRSVIYWESGEREPDRTARHCLSLKS